MNTDSAGVPANPALFADPNLSARAKGVYGILASFGEGRQLAIETIASYTSDGITAVRAAVRELEAAGWLQRTRQRKPEGTFGATFYVLAEEAEPVPTGANGWAYLIAERGTADLAKIGCSSDPTRRLASLQTGWPRELAILWQQRGGAALEAFLHNRFSARRIRGEWFDFADTDAVELVTAAAREFRAR